MKASRNYSAINPPLSANPSRHWTQGDRGRSGRSNSKMRPAAPSTREFQPTGPKPLSTTSQSCRGIDRRTYRKRNRDSISRNQIAQSCHSKAADGNGNRRDAMARHSPSRDHAGQSKSGDATNHQSSVIEPGKRLASKLRIALVAL